MNVVTLVGRVTGQPYFNLVGTGRQPFLSFYVQVGGPRKEGPLPLRVVVYGPEAKRLFDDVRAGRHVEVAGRLRKRANVKAREETRARFAQILARCQLEQPTLAAELVAAVDDAVTAVYEVVAYQKLVRVIGETVDGEALEA